MGKLITFSGIDGCGKSTYATMLKEYYNSKGIDKVVILDAMKGGRYIDELKKITQQQNIPDIRNMFSPDLINLAWTADLIYRYEKIVKDYLQKDYYVILHRSDLCCRVYSRLFGNPEYAIIIEKMLDNLDFVPDIRIFLDIDPDLAYGRLIQRNNSDALSQKEKLEYLKAADEIYKDHMSNNSYKNIYVISVNSNKEMVFNNILSII